MSVAEKWQGEMEAWQRRRLDDLEVVYIWADGIYVKAGLEKERAVVLVVMAALGDGTKVVVSVRSGYRESTQSWSEVLKDLEKRGMNKFFRRRDEFLSSFCSFQNASEGLCASSRDPSLNNHF